MQGLHLLQFMYFLKLISDSGVKDVPKPPQCSYSAVLQSSTVRTSFHKDGDLVDESPVKRKQKKQSRKRSWSMSVSPIPKNRSRSNSPHSPSDSSRSSSPLSSRSASPKANSLTRSPGWSSKQSKKSNILSESKKHCYDNNLASNKISSTRRSPLPSSSKSTSLKLGPSSSRSFECSSKEVKEPKTSSKCNYINGSSSNKNKFPTDNASLLMLIIYVLCVARSCFFSKFRELVNTFISENLPSVLAFCKFV